MSSSRKVGLARLSLTTVAALTPEEIDVRIIDTRIEDVDYGAVIDLVGIKALTSEIPSAYEIAERFRATVFFDDNIVARPGYAKELMKALIPLKITWGVEASITLARDEELLSLYSRSGGRYAFIKRNYDS